MIQIAVVSYWYPMADDKWHRIMAIKPALVVVNPSSGQGTIADPHYQQLCVELKARGIKLVGYLATDWGKKPIQKVMAERRSYLQWYPEVSGFFYDQASTAEADWDYYERLLLPGTGGMTSMIVNPGTYPAKDYLKLPAIKMVVETDMGSFIAGEPPAWANAEPNRNHFWFCVYGVRTASEMRRVVNVAAKRGAGFLWICEDKKYDRPPPYLEEMAALVRTL